MPAHHSLPLLEQRDDELSKCGYCPKLCRATCLVSEAEPREALNPWGKMTGMWDLARGAALTDERAELAWACSGCFRCREACDHRNPVADTLRDARSDLVALGHEPEGIRRLLARAGEIEAERINAVARLASEPGVEPAAPRALLLGCLYARRHLEESRTAIRLAVQLAGPVRLLSGCCGSWQRSAGGAALRQAAQAALRSELHGVRRLFVLDAGCALELRAHEPTTLVELAARHLSRFERVAESNGAVRYHDSCALGRGFGLYDEPRTLLQRLLGKAPEELTESRELSRCSGAGALLPTSFPEIARSAAERLAADHTHLGGGTLVTACAPSLTQLRRVGVDAMDLMTLLGRGLAHG
jgi:Fe-S oxidoreductase